MQASVTLWPYVSVSGGPGSCLPSTRKLSSITPVRPRSPAVTCSAIAAATAGWRRWSLPLLPWLASTISRRGSPAPAIRSRALVTWLAS
jgi:hypothetical protein